MGKKRREQKVRVWRKKCPSLGLCDMQRGMRSGLRTALDNAASVSLERQWIQLGKVIISSDSSSGGVNSSSLPTTWRLSCLIWGAGRGQREEAGALVYCSSTLLPTTERFIPLGNAAVTVLSLQRRQQGPGNGHLQSHASPESCQPLGLCLEQFGASSQTWALNLCKGFQETDWESRPGRVLGEMQ